MATSNSNESTSPAFQWRTFAIGAALVLLAGMTAAGTRAMMDRGKRSALETVEKPATAVGDEGVFDYDGSYQDGDVLVQYGGRDLKLAKREKVRCPDASMRVVGKDDAGKITIFERDGSKEKETYYLRLEPGEYIRVK